MSGKHTQTTWERNGCKIKAHGRGIIAILPLPQNGGVFEIDANADLIAMAPAMYEVLKEVERSLPGNGLWSRVHKVICRVEGTDPNA
jgi:hypothetical protein